ncbi:MULTISPECIES: SGNH/GDSL hydrolase family protein [unclassified Microbacterium]|uniref:SGNH/GDSL hydrolase family protein n=1 Tax=unclassified Microbacterium TaxID=2609290 RepID=UPI0016034338|nr:MULTISPECIES: SGNH/GDSL hydrolase family protein [unclassified Microbacterium]MBT2485510.1 SGNH/GDSL hydrolase family protein [Microbacterium sp. ISL-108]
MHASSTRRRLRTTGIAFALLFAVIAGVLGVWRPWTPSPTAAPVGAAAGEGSAPAMIAPLPLSLPEHPSVLVFGDSWTYGSAANVPTLGYAYVLADLLAGETVVDGVRGSGYLKPGLDGPTFGERIALLDPALSPNLIIIQGSINDRAQGVAGYREAVTAAWDALAAAYPEAQIVVLGPAPHELPVGAETSRIDADLSELAGARGWWYISPIGQKWITEQNYLDVIDVGIGRKHPSTDGHRYLAERLSGALDELRGAPVTEARESETTPDE